MPVVGNPFAPLFPPPAAARPVTWAEAKLHLNLDDDADQTYVESLIDAATDFAEECMSMTLMPRTLVATFADARDGFTLPRGPLIAVVSIVNGAAQAVTSYGITTVGRSSRLVLAPSTSLVYPLTVTYTAGHTSAEAIPPSIRVAILQHVASLYRTRESISEKQMVSVPQSLADFYRAKCRATGIA